MEVIETGIADVRSGQEIARVVELNAADLNAKLVAAPPAEQCQIVNLGVRGAVLLLRTAPGKTTPGDVTANGETRRRTSLDYGLPRGTIHAEFCFVDQLRAEDLLQGEYDVFRNDVS